LGFLKDLKDCSGVISNAGFELASEALQLGKKILVKPLAGQIEQISNALAILNLGIGRVMKHLDSRQMAEWLALPPRQSVLYPDTARLLALWVESGHWEDIERLARQAWSGTLGFPQTAWH
jgi:predicted glycosyltransferase